MERVAKPFSFGNNQQQDKPVSVYSPYFALKKARFNFSSFLAVPPLDIYIYDLKFALAQRSIKTNLRIYHIIVLSLKRYNFIRFNHLYDS